MQRKIIEKAPEITNLSEIHWLMDEINDLGAIVKRANDDYLYWDKFKHLSFPKEIGMKDLWGILKLTRLAQLKRIPLKSTTGDDFGFWLPDKAQRLLREFDLHLAGEIAIQEPVINPSSKQQYIISSLMEEAIASSQIEGAATSRKVAKELLRTGRKPANHAEKMIFNNYVTIQKITKMQGEKLTPDMILDLQESLTEGTLEDSSYSGAFRKTDDVYVIDDRKNEILHEPPPARDLPKRLALMCEFANTDKYDGGFIHPIIKAILLHFWLAYDHPFVDGNGRTARAIFYWYMLSNGYWMFEYLSISRHILISRGQYERAYIYAEQDGFDATYFVMYHLGIIEKALIDLQHYLDRKQEEQKKVFFLLRGKVDINQRQQALIKHALGNPGFAYTIESHRNSHGVSYPTARQDLISLADQGLLVIDKSKRSWRFLAPDDLPARLS